ncbi:preprotein translocase subunit SecE [Glaciibacter superstes]|uniref:preprotein translocase subunit SecE n=1 Tax=Glaciibacter superstes TaxID=501023 RepID=UPI0003B46181|nr:preprotein translocase subunit SecE [Glaciibacter superstes]
MARKVIDDQPSEEFVANARKVRESKSGPFARLSIFLKQVVAELKKVVTPTRKELFTYTGVVLVFVIIMMAFVYGLDQLFALAVTYVFGTPSG